MVEPLLSSSSHILCFPAGKPLATHSYLHYTMDPDNYSDAELAQATAQTTIANSINTPSVDPPTTDPEEESYTAEQTEGGEDIEAPTAENLIKASRNLEEITRRTYGSLFPVQGRQNVKKDLDTWAGTPTDHDTAFSIVKNLADYVAHETAKVEDSFLNRGVRDHLEGTVKCLNSLKGGDLKIL